METTDVAAVYEPIKDNYIYGIYKDTKVVIDTNTGYINATRLCKDKNKTYRPWAVSNKTIINRLETSIELPGIDKISYAVPLGPDTDRVIAGIYVDPILVPYITAWVSPSKVRKVSVIMQDYAHNDLVKQYKESISKLKTSVDTLTSIILDTYPNIIHKPVNTGKYSLFVVFKTNRDNCPNEYYITKVQEKDFAQRERELRDQYPELNIKLYLEKIPNSKYLFNRLIHSFGDKISVNRNLITLTSITEEEFVTVIKDTFIHRDLH